MRNDESVKVNCPKCDKVMVISYEKDKLILYKCQSCGHMKMIINNKEQDWERDNL